MWMTFESLKRFEEAMETIAERVRRVAAALEQSGVPYQVVGGVAVAAWVGSVDSEAVRATRDIDIVIRREDLDRARAALEPAGFSFRQVLRTPMFVDREKRRVKGGVHLLYENEKVKAEDIHPVPEMAKEPPRSEDGFRIAPLDSLVTMKLTSFRDKDRVHLRDLLEVGLITPEIERSLPPDLLERLQKIKDNPEG